MTTEINAQNKSTAEFLFVLYCYSFSFAKPLITAVKSLSAVILLAVAAVILFVYIFTNMNSINSKNLLRFSVFSMYMLVFFVLQVVFAGNATVYSHIYNFCIYGFIPIFLLINVKDYSKVLKYWCYMSLVAGLIFLLDPFVGYKWSGGYMPLGFNHLLPAFASSIIIWLFYGKKIGIATAAVLFVDMLLYTNKGASITAVVLFVLFYLFAKKNKHNKKITGVVVGLGLFAILVILLRFQIFEIFYSLAKSFGISSYSLNTFREMLYKSPEKIFSIRTNIWENVLLEFKTSPILGIGIGTFQENYQLYPHNVMLDVLSSVGIFAFAFFVIMTIASIFYIKKLDKDKKVFMFMLLILWIVPMQISLSLWSYMFFWIYFGVFMYRDRDFCLKKGGKINV